MQLLNQLLNLSFDPSQASNGENNFFKNKALEQAASGNLFQGVFVEYAEIGAESIKFKPEELTKLASNLEVFEEFSELSGNESSFSGKGFPFYPSEMDNNANLPGFRSGPLVEFEKEISLLGELDEHPLSSSNFLMSPSAKKESFELNMEDLEDQIQTILSKDKISKSNDSSLLNTKHPGGIEQQVATSEIGVLDEANAKDAAFRSSEAIGKLNSINLGKADLEESKPGSIKELLNSNTKEKVTAFSLGKGSSTQLDDELVARTIDTKAGQGSAKAELELGQEAKVAQLLASKKEALSQARANIAEKNYSEATSVKNESLAKLASNPFDKLSILSTGEKSFNLNSGGIESAISQSTSSSTTSSSVQPHLTNLSSTQPGSTTELKGISSNDFNQGLNIKSRFAPELSVRIQWMMRQSLSSAEILMDPPELGPMTIKVQQNNGELSLLFQVNNTNTKDALDENMGKLKDLLQQHGLALGDAQVKQEGKDENDAETNNKSGIIAEDESVAENEDSTSVTHHRLGVVDLYT